MTDPRDDSGRKADGTFANGNSLGQTGRPKGSKNKVTRAMESLLEGEAEALSRKLIELALAGDSTALRLCFERLLAPVKDRAISVELPSLESSESISQAAKMIVNETAAGNLTPIDANRLLALVETRRKALETEDLEKRIRRLEQARGQA